MRASVPGLSSVVRRAVAGVVSFAFLLGCGSGGTATTTSGSGGSTTTTNQYATAYKSATFASGVTASFPSSCSMTISATGSPYAHDAYYLGPVGPNGGTVVATTPSGIQLMVLSYAQLSNNTPKTVSGTFNICPTKANSTTATSGGAIGVIFSGTSLFNPYEATGTVAMSDNVSYTFTQGGTTYTASFLDTCSQHTNGGGTAGVTWHFHANPTCWTSKVDGSGASHMIGIALDGFPIYGGRDVNGNIVDTASLDSCNGITSATPEFPNGAYHYVLPIQSNGQPVTTSKSSLNCYSGTVNATLSAQMKKLACKMPMLLASGKMRLPDGREVSRNEAAAWVKETMPDMKMDGMPGMVMAGASGAKSPHSGHHMAGM